MDVSSTADHLVKRTRLSPHERRSQLIALGVRMLGERAPEEISVSEIAAQAGISRGLLFHYFPTKHDFLLAVVEHANTELLDRITPDHTLGILAMLRDSIGRYIDYVADNRTSYLALLRGPTSVSPDLVPLVDSTRDAVVALVLAEAPVSLPEGRVTRLRLGLRGWVAFVEETTLTWLREEPITRDELVDLLVDSLVGLAGSLEPALAEVLTAATPTMS